VLQTSQNVFVKLADLLTENMVLVQFFGVNV